MKIFFDNTEKFRFTGTGDLHVDNDIIAFSTTTASDERLKTNIETIENPIQKINRLRGATYHWKLEDKNQDSNMGLIAQEVERVFPFLVKENIYTTEPLLRRRYLISMTLRNLKQNFLKNEDYLKRNIKV